MDGRNEVQLQETKMSKTYKTTKADFVYFEKHCWWWIRYFGMLNFKYIFYHEQLEDRSAQWHISYQSKHCIISLSTEMQDQFDRKFIACCAFHELYETSLHELITMCYYVFSADHINERLHGCVRTMENTLFEEKWESTLKRLK